MDYDCPQLEFSAWFAPHSELKRLSPDTAASTYTFNKHAIKHRFCRLAASTPMGKERIMYIERKAGGLNGPARIVRVSFSEKGATLYYQGRAFQSLKGHGFKANHFDVLNGDPYWISGPKKNGQDRLHGSNTSVEVDEDVLEDYWTKIRRLSRVRG